ncbi:MAG: hypothetical protein AB7E51_06745 [Pseudodesulfovibrio sp.]|uniref:TipJ family phage tail tip protein n=1 Tax=Pseudodesulfovibrio sp. TaxID=2035812 RepID=UPI003D0B3390
MSAAPNLPAVVRPGIPDGCAVVTVQPNPLRAEFHSRRVPAGVRVSTAVRHECARAGVNSEQIKNDARVWINGRFEPDALVLLPGQEVFITMAPQFGGGGGGKDVFLAVAQIAMMAMAMTYAPYLVAGMSGYPMTGVIAGQMAILHPFATAIMTGGLMMGGSYLLGSLGGPSQPASSYTSGADQSSVYSLGGMQNAINPWGKIPLNLGFNRYAGPKSAIDYFEYAANDMFQRTLVDWTYGPVEVSGLQIADTPLTKFSDYKVQTTSGVDGDPEITLYPDDVNEDTLSITLDYNEPVVRRTAPDCDEIVVDIVWAMLIWFGNSSTSEQSCDVRLRYRAVGASEWTDWTVVSESAETQQALRRSRRVEVPRGQYDVQVTCLTEIIDEKKQKSTPTWTCLRTITNRPPTNYPFRVAQTALRIRANEEFQGAVDELNAMVKTIALDWDAASETWIKRKTQNPPSLARWAVQSDACPRPLDNSMIDLVSFARFHEHCAANGFTFNRLLDTGRDIPTVLAEILYVGQGYLDCWEGQYSVVIDEEQDGWSSSFTPETSWGWKARKRFEDPPHGFRCRFWNGETLQWDEFEVYATFEGYTAANASASRMEVFEAPGIDNYEQMYKIALYQLAIRWRRGWYYDLNTNWRFLDARRGQRCRIRHWALVVGQGSGRVKGVVANADYTATVTLDADMTMEEGKDYCLEISGPDTGEIVRTVRTVAGTSRTVILEDDDLPDPVKDDIWMFGERGVTSRDVLLVGIEPGSNLVAKLTFVDYAPEVLTAWTGDIPPRESVVRVPAWSAPRAPAAPIIDMLVSDETVMERTAAGDLVAHVRIGYTIPSGVVPVSSVEAHVRDVGGSWRLGDRVAAGQPLTLSGVKTGDVIDFRIHSVTTAGAASEWVYKYEYTVEGKSTKPPAVGPVLVDNGWLTWDYPDEPIDHDGFIVRHASGARPYAGAGVAAHEDIITDTRFDLSPFSGTMTFMVWAVDVAGNESEEFRYVITNLGDPVVENIVEEFAFGPLWAGTIAGGEVVDGRIEASAVSLFYAADDDPIYADDNEPFYPDDRFSALSYEARLIMPETLVGEQMTLALTAAGNVSVMYRKLPPTPFYPADSEPFYDADGEPFYFGAANIPDWRPWPGSLTVERAEYQFLVSVPSGTVQGVIESLAVVVDTTDVFEELLDVAIEAGGSKLPTTKTWRAIKTVTVMALQESATAINFQKVNLDLDGPTLKAVDGAGTSVAATGDFKIGGY